MKTDVEIIKKLEKNLIAITYVKQFSYCGTNEENTSKYKFMVIVNGKLTTLEKAVVKRVLNPKNICYDNGLNLFCMNTSDSILEYGPLTRSNSYDYIIYAKPDTCKLSGCMSWDWKWDNPVTYISFCFKYKSKDGKITQI